MDRYGVKDWLAFSRYLDEVGIEEIGGPLIPIGQTEDGQPDIKPVAHRLADVLRERFSALEQENKRLRERIKFLEKHLNLYRQSDEKKATDALKPLLELNQYTGKLLTTREGNNVDILSEAESILTNCPPPDLQTQLSTLKDKLGRCYWDAVDRQEWHRALVVYQQIVLKPVYSDFEPLHSEFLP